MIIACMPAYNVENTISQVITESLKYVDRVIVCDDGSTDMTYEKAISTGATILKHNKNMGKGKALQTLFDYCKKISFDALITIDSDGQFLPIEIKSLVEPILKEKFDIVIGNRYSNLEQMPKYRKIGNKMLDKITKMAAELPFSDTQSGFRSYSKKAIDEIKFETNGFGVDSEILIDAFHKGMKISETNVTVIYNTGQNTSSQNPISHTMNVLTTIIEQIAIHHPLKFLGIPGLILIMVGIIFAGIAIINFSEFGNFSLPSVLISMSTLIFGLILLLISVVMYGLHFYQSKN